MQPTWNEKSLEDLYQLPFFDLIYQAHTVHKANFPPTDIELCTLLSIKTGTCPEDCGYCSQSGHYKTGYKKEKLLDVELVIQQAKAAKKNGATRFCMGAAWRSPPKAEFPKVLRMVQEVKALGLETCVTLGMLDEQQALELKAAGLDYYNHNLDTSPEHYEKVVSTRTYQDRLDTLERVRKANINVCCGGIMGMGESRQDRIRFLLQLLKLPKAPESIPINHLIPVKGTPLENAPPLDSFEFIRMIAVTRIVFPTSMIRLSAGRDKMSEEMQAWCFMAGANSMWNGEVLLTLPNPGQNHDAALLQKLGMKAMQPLEQSCC